MAMTVDQRTRNGERIKAMWYSMTPERKAARLEQLAEARRDAIAQRRAAGEQPKPGRRMEPPSETSMEAEPMQPVRLDPELKLALQQACWRWVDYGATWDLIEDLCVAVVTTKELHRPLLLIRRAVLAGNLDASMVGHMASLTDAMVLHNDLPGPRLVMDALCLLVGIDPEVQLAPIPLPPVPGSHAWVQ